MLQQMIKQQKLLKKDLKKRMRAYISMKEMEDTDDSSLDVYLNDFEESRENFGNFLRMRNIFEKRSVENEDGYKVGDILYSSWGYDCTRIDFYKVVRTSKKMIWVAPIQSKKDYSSAYSGTTTPVSKFESFEAIKLKSSNPTMDFSCLSLYDDSKEIYFSDPN